MTQSMTQPEGCNIDHIADPMENKNQFENIMTIMAGSSGRPLFGNIDGNGNGDGHDDENQSSNTNNEGADY